MNNSKINTSIAILLIVLAAISRVVMYPDNFSPIAGMALFAGAIFTNKKLAYSMPLLAMLLSDVLFQVSGIAPGFWGVGQVVNYAALFAITFLGTFVQAQKPLQIAGFSVLSSVVFFALSNLGFFAFENPIYQLYPQSANGLIQCYVAALPFFKTAIIADLVYSAVLFGGYYLVSQLSTKKAIA